MSDEFATEPDWTAARGLFPVLKRWTYLNTATFGPIPTIAEDAIEAHHRDRNETASLGFLAWFDRLDDVRVKAAGLIGAQPDDIAFCPSAGVALSWLLNGLDWRPGDQIVALENEFPNNLYAPNLLDHHGVRFRPYALGEAAFDPQAFLDSLGDRTRLVVMSAVSYSNGLRPPIDELGSELRSRGILFCVDGTQSVGAIRHNVSTEACDCLIVHGYKWMLSPPGAGFFYVSPQLREQLRPTVVSWRSHRNWKDVDRLHHGRPELPDEAAQYEGGIQNFSGIFAMEAVLDLMAKLGASNIESRVLSLAAKTRETLGRHGGVLSHDSCPYYESPIVSAGLPGHDVSTLASNLEERRIAVAARKGRLRVSVHFFNNEADLAALDEALGSGA